MYFSEDSFEKYSIHGTFERRLKLSGFFSSDEATASSSGSKANNMLDIMDPSSDHKWYGSLMRGLIDKELKLKDPIAFKYHPPHHQQQHHQQAHKQQQYHQQQRYQQPVKPAIETIRTRKPSTDSPMLPITPRSDFTIAKPPVFRETDLQKKTREMSPLKETKQPSPIKPSTPLKKPEPAMIYEPKSPPPPPQPPSAQTSEEKLEIGEISSEEEEKLPPPPPPPKQQQQQQQQIQPAKQETKTPPPKQLEISPTSMAIPQKPAQHQPQRQQAPPNQYQKRGGGAPYRMYHEPIRRWYPLRVKLDPPRRSRLDANEQKEYLQFYAKFKDRAKLTQAEVRFYKKFLHYKQSVEKERPEFMAYIEEYYKNASEDYEFLTPHITRYVNSMIDCAENQAISFDRYYTRLNEINIAQLDLNGAKTIGFKLEKNIVQLGNVQKIILPSITLEEQPNLKTDCNEISKRVPVDKTAKKLNKIILSDDRNVEKLASKYDFQIAMTNSAFVSLVYHLSIANDDDLKIPFSIKTIRNPTTGAHKKVILIEKPLVEKFLTTREKNEKFYKRSLMVSLVKTSTAMNRSKRDVNQGGTRKQQSLSIAPDERKVEQQNTLDYNLLANLETFGLATSSKAASKPEETTEKPISKQDQEKASSPSSPVKKRSLEEIESPESPPPPSSPPPEANLKPVNIETKRIKTDLSSDNESYSDEEDENEKLMIVDEQAANKKEEPKSLKEDKPPNSPSPKKEVAFPITSKIIPIESKSEAKSSKAAEAKSDDDDEDEEEKLSLFDLINKMQKKLSDGSKSASVATTPTTPMQNPLTAAIASIIPGVVTGATGNTPSSHKQAENSREFDYIENVHDNVSYSLWSIGNQRPSPQDKSNFKILVRQSIDGYVNTETSSLNSIVLYPKLEYQPQFGCEKLTNKDLCKMWTKSFLRNNCDVFLCRINVFTSKLISVTKLKHEEILPKDCEFNPNLSLHHLKSFLEIIINYEEGNYLLTKEPKSQKLNIMKSTTNKVASFDLHFYYTGFNVVNREKISQWVPIDPELYLPYHQKMFRVPCLFEPVQKDYRSNKTSPSSNSPRQQQQQQQQQRQRNPNPPKRKRKNKNKNTNQNFPN